ncbi:MAG: alkaline phosphatase family protein, partial [Sphingomicrobium sp.]
MKLLGSFAAVTALVAMPVSAAQAPQAPPKLLIAISVDQFSADLFDSYRPYFTGGLARIASGTVFRNGYQSHAATETCPGHSTLLTAWHPSKTGIVANSWVDQSIGREDKTVYCAEDETVPGSTSTAYTVSAKHLDAQTLGDLIKKASPASRNVAVAGKDRAAVMMGGRAVDQRWYWDGKTFASDNKAAKVPASVTAFNAALEKALAQPREAMTPPAFCAGKDEVYAVSPTLSVGNGRFTRKAGDTSEFRRSPDFDGATLALSAALINELGLGRGAATDVLSVGLSATDYVGHAYGTGGMEMCLQMAALDLQLGSFLATLDRNGLDYAVVLTADHGGLDIPERLSDRGVADAARVDPALVASEVGKRIGGLLGLGGPVILGSGASGEFWISTKLAPADRKRVLDMALKTYRAHPQVYAAVPKSQVAATPMPGGDPRGWTVLQRLRASFDPKRSGDFMVVLKPNITPIPAPSTGYVSTHGSPWDYDRRVPIIFWRKGMAGSARNDWADTVDLMPT